MEVIKKYLLKKLFLKRSFVVMLPVLLFFGVAAPSHFAHAFGLGDIFSPVTKLLDIILGIFFLLSPFGIIKIALIFGGILGMIPVIISAFVLNLVLGDALIFAPYTHGGIVDVGWLITRDIANLAFIVIILAIAVATMLGQQDRGIRLLPKLIGVALLINFTKVIAGMIVDFANIITNYFLEPVKSYGNIAVNLFFQESPVWRLIESAFALGKDLGPNPLTWLKIIDFLQANLSLSGLLSDMIGTILMLIISFLLSFTLLVFAAIFFVRYIAIWLLVIFSPLAFAAMILPDTAKFARQWWNEFIKWSFIGMGPAFILYLSAKIIELKDAIMISGGDGYTASQALVVQEGGFLQNLLSPLYIIVADLLFWLVILIFIWIGLMATMSMNSKISGMLVEGGLKVGGWIKDEAMRRYGKRIQDVGTRITQRGIGTGLGIPGTGRQLRIGGEPARQLGKRIEAFGKSGIEQQLERAAAEAPKQGSGYNLAHMETTPFWPEFAAKLRHESQKNPEKVRQWLESGGDELRSHAQNMVNRAALTGNEDQILDYLPDLARDEKSGVSVDPARSPAEAELARKVAAGEVDAGDARVQAYVSRMPKKDLENTLSLRDPDVVAGIKLNRSAILGDLANSPGKFDDLLEEIRARLGPDTDEAYGEIADILLGKGQGIENIPTDLLDDKLLQQIANRPEKITAQVLGRIIRLHDKMYVDRIFQKMTARQLDVFKRGKRPIKDLMPEDVLGYYDDPPTYIPPGGPPPPPTSPGGEGPTPDDGGDGPEGPSPGFDVGRGGRGPRAPSAGGGADFDTLRGTGTRPPTPTPPPAPTGRGAAAPPAETATEGEGGSTPTEARTTETVPEATAAPSASSLPRESLLSRFRGRLSAIGRRSLDREMEKARRSGAGVSFEKNLQQYEEASPAAQKLIASLGQAALGEEERTENQ